VCRQADSRASASSLASTRSNSALTHTLGQFFLKGTQLQQLSDDYQVILENIQRADAVLKQKGEAIPDLKLAYRAAVEKYRQATSLVQQQTEIDELIRELAWAHVYEKQKVMYQSHAT